MRRPLALAVAGGVLLASVVLVAADRDKPIALHPDYDHNRFGTAPVDLERAFRAYTVSFDSADDDNHDGQADRWAIPHWVAYDMQRFPGTLPAAPDRPSPWLSERGVEEDELERMVATELW